MKKYTPILMFMTVMVFLFLPQPGSSEHNSKNPRPRELGIQFGHMKTGKLNAITDVPGVMVGHLTLVQGESIRTGVTAVLPHDGNLFHKKVPAAIYIGNGFGKLAGYTQVQELGEIESPILLTNTLSIGAVLEGGVQYMLSLPDNTIVRSVNIVVGECNDGYLNDIRGLHVRPEHAIQAIRNAKGGPVTEGCAGAGTGTICHGFKGGIGTSSRILSKTKGSYTIGVLVQTNFGRDLHIDGVPIGRLLKKLSLHSDENQTDQGSCMIVIATNAPVDSKNLLRMAKRAMLGMAKTGGISSNGSGDYVIAFSTAAELRRKHGVDLISGKVLNSHQMTTLFEAVVEATEEAIINSLFAAETTTGKSGRKVNALPVDRVLSILREYRHLDQRKLQSINE